jgi:hypothetical protein
MSTENNTTQYGARMGRQEVGTTPPPTGVRLRQIRINASGYDNTGAYWGLGQPLYRAEAHEKLTLVYRRFVRATSRDQAAEKLGLTPSQLRRTKAPGPESTADELSRPYAVASPTPSGLWHVSRRFHKRRQAEAYLAEHSSTPGLQVLTAKELRRLQAASPPRPLAATSWQG